MLRNSAGTRAGSGTASAPEHAAPGPEPPARSPLPGAPRPLRGRPLPIAELGDFVHSFTNDVWL